MIKNAGDRQTILLDTVANARTTLKNELDHHDDHQRGPTRDDMAALFEALRTKELAAVGSLRSPS